jgi:hypothetical protein
MPNQFIPAKDVGRVFLDAARSAAKANLPNGTPEQQEAVAAAALCGLGASLFMGPRDAIMGGRR